MSDPRSLWQNQQEGVFHMSADGLRSRVRRRTSKARLQAGLGICLGVAMALYFAYQTIVPGRAFHGSAVSRTGLGVLVLWSLLVAIQSFRWIWPRSIPDGDSIGTTMRAYKAELEKSRDYNRDLWRKSGLTVCFAGLALVIGPGAVAVLSEPRLAVRMAPLFVLLAAWGIMYRTIRQRRRRVLDDELAALRRLEKM